MRVPLLQQNFALLRGRLESAIFIVCEDSIYNFIGFVHHGHQIDIFRTDGLFGHQRVFEPAQKTLPKRRIHQNDGNFSALSRLHQREDLRQFVQRAEAPREAPRRPTRV